MGLLESIVDRSFRDEKAGRVVVFQGDRRNRGYVVRSEADELRIRSFLKMFYFAHLSILWLGMLLANAWSMFVIDLQLFGRPAKHLLPNVAVFLAVYLLVVGLPYFFLWRSYKASLANFVSAQDEISVSGTPAGRQPWAAIWLVLFGSLIILAIILYLLIRAR